MNDLRSLLLALAAALLALPACQAESGPPPLEGARMRNAFNLVSHEGRRVADTAYAGKYRIVYFGYTFCPDVCPVDLQLISAALRQFEGSDPGRAAKVQPIFITTDPARDTPEVLADFARNFHPRLLALTGTAEEIGRTGREHGIYFTRREGTAEGAPYLLDHSRYAVLYGPEGKPVSMLPHDEGVPGIVQVLDRWVR
ncbi:MAG TPA: SCO family protein [Allosphingosinicella sp.]|jgi:protein SCO1/2|nr:SCO family protein [Allosphingosinicella sp.]